MLALRRDEGCQVSLEIGLVDGHRSATVERIDADLELGAQCFELERVLAPLLLQHA